MLALLAVISFVLAFVVALFNTALGPFGWPEFVALGLALMAAGGWVSGRRG